MNKSSFHYYSYVEVLSNVDWKDEPSSSRSPITMEIVSSTALSGIEMKLATAQGISSNHLLQYLFERSNGRLEDRGPGRQTLTENRM